MNTEVKILAAFLHFLGLSQLSQAHHQRQPSVYCLIAWEN